MNGDKESLGELMMTLNTASLNDETGPWRSFDFTSVTWKNIKQKEFNFSISQNSSMYFI